MTTIRQQRVAELLFKELSIMVGNELDNPKLSFVQVTRVEISRDLRNAKVYVNHQQDEVSARELMKNLQRAAPTWGAQLVDRGGRALGPEFLFGIMAFPTKPAPVVDLLLKMPS